MPCISKAEYSCLVFCYMSPKGSYFYNHSMHLYVKPHSELHCSDARTQCLSTSEVCGSEVLLKAVQSLALVYYATFTNRPQ